MLDAAITPISLNQRRPAPSRKSRPRMSPISGFALKGACCIGHWDKRLEADHPRFRRARGGMELVHSAELDPLVEGRGCKPPCVDTGPTGPQRHVCMGSDLLVPVRWPDRHKLGG